jgi:sulfatase maturation enzyme AslB (radical SAM superfamily)
MPDPAVDLQSLMLVLTSGCNLRCRYCYIGARQQPPLRWPLLRRSLERAMTLPSSNLEVSFTGGEPMLAFPLLKRVVRHVEGCRPADSPVRFRVLTNGLLLDDRALAYFDAHDVSLNVSFDGVAASQAHRGPSTFQRLDHLLDRLRQGFPRLWRSRVRISATLTPETIPHVAASIEYFIRKGAQTLAVTPAVGGGRFDLEGIHELDRQFTLASAALRDHYERTGDVPLTTFRRSRFDEQPKPAEWLCLAARGGNVIIDVDGRAYGCVLACPSYQQQTPSIMLPVVSALAMGPAASPALASRRAAMADNARAAGALLHPERRYSSYRRCADCEYFGRCAACPLAPAAEAEWDDPLRVTDFICAFNQVVMAHRDRFPPQVTLADLASRAKNAS